VILAQQPGRRGVRPSSVAKFKNAMGGEQTQRTIQCIGICSGFLSELFRRFQRIIVKGVGNPKLRDNL